MRNKKNSNQSNLSSDRDTQIESASYRLEEQYSEDQVLHNYYASKRRHLNLNEEMRQHMAIDQTSDTPQADLSQVQHDKSTWQTLSHEQKNQLLSRPQDASMHIFFPGTNNNTI